MGSPLQAKKRRQNKKFNSGIGEAQRALTRLSRTASRKDFIALCDQLIKNDVKTFLEDGNIVENASQVVLDWAQSVHGNDNDVYEQMYEIKEIIGSNLMIWDQSERIRSYTTLSYSHTAIQPLHVLRSAYIDGQLPAYTMGDRQTAWTRVDRTGVQLMRGFGSLPCMGIVMLLTSIFCVGIGGMSLLNYFVAGASVFPPAFSISLVLLGIGWSWTVIFSI
jgi:hypothetical protein